MDCKCILNGQTPWCRPLVLTGTIWEEVPFSGQETWQELTDFWGLSASNGGERLRKQRSSQRKKSIHPQASGAIWPWPAGLRAVSICWVMQGYVRLAWSDCRIARWSVSDDPVEVCVMMICCGIFMAWRPSYVPSVAMSFSNSAVWAMDS